MTGRRHYCAHNNNKSSRNYRLPVVLATVGKGAYAEGRKFARSSILYYRSLR